MNRRFQLPNAFLVSVMTALACTAKPEFTGRVTVLTYDADDPTYLTGEISSVIRQANADVVCVQEARSAWCREFRRQFREEYPQKLFVNKWLDFGFGKQPAFFSKYALRAVQYVPSVENGSPNSWIVEADTPAGPVQIANVRLSGAALEMDAVLTAMKPDVPTIIAGEFNSQRDAAVGRAVEKGYIDALPRFDAKTPTWRVRQLLVHVAREQRDHILCSSHFEPVSACVLSTDKSDHSPVVAELKLTETAASMTERTP